MKLIPGSHMVTGLGQTIVGPKLRIAFEPVQDLSAIPDLGLTVSQPWDYIKCDSRWGWD